jgi:hypothetical protein
MTGNQQSSSDDDARVVSFRSGRPVARPRAPDTTPVEDLAKYHGKKESNEEYRQRMIVNVAAFAFIVALVGAGLWLADSMAQMRKNDDCLASGRRNCAPIEVTKPRW